MAITVNTAVIKNKDYEKEWESPLPYLIGM